MEALISGAKAVRAAIPDAASETSINAVYWFGAVKVNGSPSSAFRMKKDRKRCGIIKLAMRIWETYGIPETANNLSDVPGSFLVVLFRTGSDPARQHGV